MIDAGRVKPCRLMRKPCTTPSAWTASDMRNLSWDRSDTAELDHINDKEDIFTVLAICSVETPLRLLPPQFFPVL